MIMCNAMFQEQEITLQKFTYIQGQIHNHFNHENISSADKLTEKNE